MGIHISKRMSSIKPSPTLAVTAKAKALKSEGKNVCSFGAGEPDFDTPAHICDAGKRAIDNGYTRYVDVPGLPSLRRALSKYLRERYSMDYAPEETIVTCGGKFGLYELFMCLVDEGDEVIIPAPYWVSYPAQVELAGGVPVFVSAGADQEFKITAAQLEAAITPRTRVLVMNSPSNPTGAVYSAEEMRAIADVIVKHDVFVISDEIYAELLYDGEHFQSFVTVRDDLKGRVAIASGWSKAYAMTGWRLGWVAAPKELISAMGKLQSQTTSNVTSMAQVAAQAALEGSHDFLTGWLAAFDRRRRMLVDGLNAIDGVFCPTPKGAFYVFADFQDVLDREWKGEPLGTSLRLADYLLEEALVAVVPGEAFGAPGCARLSYATSDDVIAEGIRRIQEAIDRLG